MLAGLRFFPSAGAVGAGRGQTGEKNSREGSRESSRPSPEGGTRHDTGKSKESGESRTQVVRIENRDFFKEKLDKAAGEQRGGRKTDGNPPRAEGEESGGTRTAAGVARGHQRASASLPSGLQSSGNAQPNEATLESGPSPLHIRELNPFLREQYLSKQNRGEEGACMASASPIPSALTSTASFSESLASRGARAWRSRQLRRLQERAAETGEAVSCLVEDHITGRNADGQDGRIWDGLLFADRDTRFSSARAGGGSSGQRARSDFRDRNDAEEDRSRDSRRLGEPSKYRASEDAVSFDRRRLSGRREGSWRREETQRYGQEYQKSRDEESSVKSVAGSAEDRNNSAGGLALPGCSKARSGGSQYMKEAERRTGGGESSAGPTGKSRFDFLRAQPKPESRCLENAGGERTDEFLPEQSKRQQDSLETGRPTSDSDPQRATPRSGLHSCCSAPVASSVPPLSAGRPSSPPPSPDNNVLRSTRTPKNPADCDVNVLAAQALKAQLAGDGDTSRRLAGLLASRQLSGSEGDLVRESARPSQSGGDRCCRSHGSVSHTGDPASRVPPPCSASSFEGEADASVAELVRRERATRHGEEYDEAYKNVLFKRGRGGRIGTESDDDLPDEVASTKPSAKRRRVAQERAKARAHALNNRQLYMDGTPWGHRRLWALRCKRAHANALTTLDESGYEEIRNFQKSLVAFFEAQNKVPIFIETVSHFVSKEKNWMGSGPHTAVEVLPIELDRLSEAKTFFRKAFDEVEGEWQQHRKVIEVRGREGVRRAIPANFPYIHVDFGLAGGLAHVIEDGRAFSSTFGQEVVLGMHELCSTQRAFPTPQSFKNAVTSFRRQFSPFDWTSR